MAEMPNPHQRLSGHDRDWRFLDCKPTFYVVYCRAHDLNEIVYAEDLPQRAEGRLWERTATRGGERNAP
jgi:hypothetical protein